MKKLIIIFCYILISTFSTRADVIDTLYADTIISTQIGELTFKGGTTITKKQDGQVIRGTLAYDTDIWTTGPLIFFSRKHPITFNKNGRVIQGVSVLDFIGQACDGKFYTFAGGYIVEWDDYGKISAGTIEIPFPIIVENQEFTIKERTIIKYYPNGKIMQATPNYNVKLKISQTETVNFMGGEIIKFSQDGNVIQGVLAKKTTFALKDGTEKIVPQGEKIKFDNNGFLITY